jgi:hypothetical protein
VVWADRRFRLGHGRAFALYVAGYTAGRFWIEQMRTDHATRVFGDIRINVVVSVLVFAAAVLYIALVRKPREVLDGAPAPAEPAPDADSDSPAQETKAEGRDDAKDEDAKDEDAKDEDALDEDATDKDTADKDAADKDAGDRHTAEVGDRTP